MGINHTNKHLIDANERLHQAPSLQPSALQPAWRQQRHEATTAAAAAAAVKQV